MGELEIILECKKGNSKAFEELVTLYEKNIYNLCIYMMKNNEDAMDATQEVFIKIYRAIKNFKGDSKFSTWAYRVTYNTCLDLLKKKKEHISYNDIINSEDTIESVSESVIEARELKLELKRCILCLSYDFRTVIILRDINGLSYQEIAEILRIEVGTVKSRLNRARQALKDELIKCGYIRGC